MSEQIRDYMRRHNWHPCPHCHTLIPPDEHMCPVCHQLMRTEAH